MQHRAIQWRYFPVCALVAALALAGAAGAAGAAAPTKTTPGAATTPVDPATAHQELQRDAQQQAEKFAREQASAEAGRQRDAAGSELDRQWSDAVERSKLPSWRDLVSLRLLALVAGLLWLRVELRRQLRQSRRT